MSGHVGCSTEGSTAATRVFRRPRSVSKISHYIVYCCQSLDKQQAGRHAVQIAPFAEESLKARHCRHCSSKWEL